MFNFYPGLPHVIMHTLYGWKGIKLVQALLVLKDTMCRSVSLVPRPPLFVLQFTFSVIRRSRRAIKNVEDLGTLIT